MSIYDQFEGTQAGTNASTPRDPVPAEGFYPRCAILQADEFDKDHRKFFKIRYEVLDGPNAGSFITQFKTLKGCPDEVVTPLEDAPRYKFPLNPGQKSMGQKAFAEIKQAVGAAMGSTVDQLNKEVESATTPEERQKILKDQVSAVRFSATEAQPLRGHVVALQVTYERYVKKDDPRRGQIKGKPGEPYVVISAFPVLDASGAPVKVAVSTPVQPMGKKNKAEAPAAPPPPPAVGLPEGWKVNPNGPDWAYEVANPSNQRKVSSF